ncbi:hypothetical protein NIES267_64050 [Calothrix parasitica NIES-267]|uniref:Uncharacterized protein n=1 Tax=Calothrix parasitica NIES-267 TaxID=1973488 RepID=A0A1Z4M072_9CYAN|nr:hypothetical protein NIES267_64050 [Calothrix parasitica NIES-267]
MLLGMNQHSLRPKESLSPQKLTITGVSFHSLILASLNAVNTNNVTSLFTVNIVFGNIKLFNALLPSLLSRSCEVLSSAVFSVSTNCVIAFEMEARRKVQQVSVYLNKPQLDLVKVLNCIKAKFLLPASLPVHPPRPFWAVMSLLMVVKNWKAKNSFSYLLSVKWVIKTTSYYLLAISHPYSTNLAWSNTQDKIPFRGKVAVLANNLRHAFAFNYFQSIRQS